WKAALATASAAANSKKERHVSHVALLLCLPPVSRNRALSVQRRFGGEGGIRTHGTGLPYTCFPSKRLRPLGHLSEGAQRSRKSGRVPRRMEAPRPKAGVLRRRPRPPGIWGRA